MNVRLFLFMFVCLQAGYVELMDGPSLFESMYSDDAEGQRMKEMPGVDELMMIYPLIFIFPF